jgi:hypothetical protein
MKTQEHTAGVTAGAKRAAHFIYYEWPTARPEAELAEYIDRETRLPQLLEALERVWDSRHEPDKWSREVSRALEAATGIPQPFRSVHEEIAHRSAKGETL